MFNQFKKNQILTDIEIRIISPQIEETIIAHKLVLASKSEYFLKLFTGSFKETDQKSIEMYIPYGYALIDLINEFYEEETNTGNLPQWQHVLEMIVCKNYLGLPFDQTILTKLDIPEEGHELLSQITVEMNNSKFFQRIISKTFKDQVSSDDVMIFADDGNIYLLDGYQRY